MSFSKARIQRFNEFENDVPPPGSYDPRFDSKVRGLAIEKSERFHDNKSVASAECNVSACTKSTGNVVPSFRTPQLPKKKYRDQTPKTASTGKPRALIVSTNEQKFKYDSQHRLADLHVECLNKDKTIQELERHIEDLKDEQRKLQKQLDELHKKQLEVEDQHRTDIETMAKLQQEVLNGTEEKYQNEVQELQARLSTIQCELDERKAEYEKLIQDSSKQDELISIYREKIDELEHHFEKQKEILHSEKEDEISRRKEMEIRVKEFDKKNDFLQEQLEHVQRLYNDVNQELEELAKKHDIALKKQDEGLSDILRLHNQDTVQLKQQLEDARAMYLTEIENLTMARDKEIAEIQQATAKKIEEEMRRIKQQADKRVENAEAVTRETLAACRTECEERVKRVIADSDAKINAMIREGKAIVEEEMRLSAERYKACLARSEMERAALDEKLTQKDCEIARLSVIFEELKSSAETQESFGQSLQMELDRAETELAEKKEELRALKDQIRAEAAMMVARKKGFEVVMAENQASVTALSKRLAQSNAEVERLQNELKRGEDCINEYRDLLNLMRSNSQMVHEQVHVLMEELDTKKGLVDQLEVESLSEVESIKSVFEAKIDDLREIATRNASKLKVECDQKTAQNIEIKNQLHEMARNLTDAQTMLLKLEERNDAHEVEISRLELLNVKLTEQQKVYEEEMRDTNQLLEEQSRKHEAALNEAKSKIQELHDTAKSLNETYSLKQENTELFEAERSQWDALQKALMEKFEEEKARRIVAEEEVKKVTEHNERLVQNYEEIAAKYAELVGHHNQRQKIKHVSSLKDKINQLEQELQGKNKAIEQQGRIIEKMKTEERRAHIKGKENVLGQAKSTHTTPVSSPHKPLTPLRNRNE